MMNRVISFLVLVPFLLSAATPAVNWFSSALFQDSNGEATISADDTILGNAFMSLHFNAGDSDGWNNVQSVKVRIWNTNTVTNGAYSRDFAEYKYYPADGHWTCLGPATWDIDNVNSSGPAKTATGSTQYRMILVFKPSSQATATGVAKSWKVRVSVADGTATTNIEKSYRLKQTASSASSEGGVFSARPNPFKIERDGTMTFAYEPGFSEDCKVDLSILTIYGENVISFKGKDYLESDPLSQDWDGKNGAGQFVASGIYTARLKISYKKSKRSETLIFNFAVFR